MGTFQTAVPAADVTAYCCLSSALNARYRSADRAYQFLNLLAELLVSCHLFVSVKIGANTETVSADGSSLPPMWWYSASVIEERSISGE